MYKILIADDEKMERDLIRYLLTRDFPGRFQILEASNGEEALLFIRREKADILLTDVQMPVFRRSTRKVPSISSPSFPYPLP